MGRLCGSWSLLGCWGSWKGLVLAAAVLSSCLPPAPGQNPVPIAVDPQDPVVGGNVTLSAQVALGSFTSCAWYRGSGDNEPDRILNVVPNGHPVSIPGPARTGRETGRAPCSLHITNLTLNDTGRYTVMVPGVTDNRIGATSLRVSELPSPEAGLITGIVIGSLAVLALGTALLCFFYVRSRGKTPRESGTAPSEYENLPLAAQKGQEAKLESPPDPSSTYEMLQHGDRAVYDVMK